MSSAIRSTSDRLMVGNHQERNRCWLRFIRRFLGIAIQGERGRVTNRPHPVSQTGCVTRRETVFWSVTLNRRSPMKNERRLNLKGGSLEFLKSTDRRKWLETQSHTIFSREQIRSRKTTVVGSRIPAARKRSEKPFYSLHKLTL